jgi:membrane-associated PAP2 superfamily phosphatase
MSESTNPPRSRAGQARQARLLLWPLVVLVLATLAIRFSDLDLIVARAVYAEQGGWLHEEHPVVLFFYNHGNLPAILVSAGAGMFWLSSCFATRLRPRRPLAIFLVLTMLLGPGLLVNAVFKGYWGRPRPSQIVDFGGEREFVRVGEPRFGMKGKSFPSGHASMGFYWLVLGVFFFNRNRKLAVGFFVLGLTHGGAMGAGRILQGAHWLSDVMWAAGMDYLSAFIVLYLVPAARPPSPPVPAASAAAAQSSPGAV